MYVEEATNPVATDTASFLSSPAPSLTRGVLDDGAMGPSCAVRGVSHTSQRAFRVVSCSTFAAASAPHLVPGRASAGGPISLPSRDPFSSRTSTTAGRPSRTSTRCPFRDSAPAPAEERGRHRRTRHRDAQRRSKPTDPERSPSRPQTTHSRQTSRDRDWNRDSGGTVARRITERTPAQQAVRLRLLLPSGTRAARRRP